MNKSICFIFVSFALLISPLFVSHIAQAAHLSDKFAALELQASANYNYYRTLRILSQESDPVIVQYLTDYRKAAESYRAINIKTVEGTLIYQKYVEEFSREIFENETQRSELVWATYASIFHKLNEFMANHPEISPELERDFQKLISLLLGEIGRTANYARESLEETTLSLLAARFKHVIAFDNTPNLNQMYYAPRRITQPDDALAIFLCTSFATASLELHTQAKQTYLTLLTPRFTQAYLKLFKDTYTHHREFFELVELVDIYRTLEPYLTLNEPIQDTSHLEMGSANRLTDQIHKAVLERLNLYFHKKVRCKRKSTSETAKYVLDPSEAEQLVENISSQFLSSLTGKHKELRMHANTVQGVTEALPEGSDPTSQGDFVKPTESTSVLVAEVSCEVMMKNQTTAQAYLTPLDEESYPVFDLQEWLSAETAKSRKSKLVCSNRQADHQASSTTTVTANRPTLRLTDGAARTYLSGKKFNSFQIKNRDFIDFLNQIGGGLVKNKGNGSEVKYFLPNFKSDRTLKPYKVFRIDFSHNGKTPMNPVALWKFFGFALEEAGLAHMEIELVP